MIEPSTVEKTLGKKVIIDLDEVICVEIKYFKNLVSGRDSEKELKIKVETIGDLIDFAVIDKRYISEIILLDKGARDFRLVELKRTDLLKNINNGIIFDFIKYLISKNKEIKAAQSFNNVVIRKKIKSAHVISL